MFNGTTILVPKKFFTQPMICHFSVLYIYGFFSDIQKLGQKYIHDVFVCIIYIDSGGSRIS